MCTFLLSKAQEKVDNQYSHFVQLDVQRVIDAAAVELSIMNLKEY